MDNTNKVVETPFFLKYGLNFKYLIMGTGRGHGPSDPRAEYATEYGHKSKCSTIVYTARKSDMH